MTNKEKFAEVYLSKLKEAVEKRPKDYAAIKGREFEVAQKMLAAIECGSANKEGYAFKETCKELKIKHTYQGIQAYLGIYCKPQRSI